jgi:hypothetical protein
MYRNGACKHGYTVRPDSRNIEDFSQVISDSFRPDATFFNALLLTKYINGRFCILHNMEFVESAPGNFVSHHIQGMDELVRLIEERFRIDPAISRSILSRLELSGDAWN